MPDAYRDALEAAQARIDQLQRENDALKRVQGGRPVTVEELEAVRIENELRTADMMFESSVRQNYGVSTNARALARTRTVGSMLGVFLVVLGAFFFLFGKEQSGAIALAMLGLVAWVTIWGSARATERRVARHKAKQEPLVRELAKLRGTSPRVEEPKLRAPVEDAESAAREGDEVEDASEKDEERRAGRR